MNNSIIRAEQVCKQVSTAEQDLTILSDVSLDVERGQSVAIIGPSGAGKSTLLGLLAGLDTPEQPFEQRWLVLCFKPFNY